MPSAPLRECNEAGCRTLTRTKHCPRHAKGENADKQHDRMRRQYDPFRALYQTLRWRWLRREVLMRDPICTLCGTAPSAIADHVIPARVYAKAEPERFYDAANLQGICKQCHDTKTRQETEEYGLASDVSGGLRL